MIKNVALYKPISFVSEFYYMSNGLTSKISWKLFENLLRNPRNSLILVDEFTLATRGPSLYVKIWRL